MGLDRVTEEKKGTEKSRDIGCFVARFGVSSGVASESLLQDIIYEPCVEDVNEQVDNVVARYVQTVEVVIDGQRKVP